MKKIFSLVLAIFTIMLCFVGCDSLKHEHIMGEWEFNESGHWQPITCNLNTCDLEPSVRLDHVDENEDSICDDCGHNVEHEHTITYIPADKAGHFANFTCGCPHDLGAVSHYDENSDYICDACGYEYDECNHQWDDGVEIEGVMEYTCLLCGSKRSETITIIPPENTKVKTTIEEASLPQFMSLEVEKHNALSNNNTISVDVYMGYITLNKDGAAFSDIVVPEEKFENYTFVLEINYNNETRDVATHNLNYFEEYECDMYQGVVHYNKYNTVQFDIDKMTGKSYGFVNVELYMISNANQRYFVSAQTLFYSVTETEIVFGLVSNPVANEGDPGIITKGWEYVEPSNSDINNDSGDAPNTPDTPKNLCGHTSSIQKADADVFDCGVFDGLVENSLNFDKLANSSLDRALIYKFDTYEEYNAFKAQYEENLNFELLSYINNYYFEENTLVLVYEIVNNSTYRYMVTGIYIEEEKICVHIKETTNAENVDWAMSGWFFAVTIDKTITDDINEYDAIIEE